MIRLNQAILLITATAAMAAPPAPPASATAPATQPLKASASPQELHEQALESLRLGQLDVASALMDKAYNATPAAQRPRPLVLNRAILDLTQRVNVMRAVRDLYQYLREHPEPDEQAQNILGAALNVSADTLRWKKGPLWQSAYREWERRNTQLNDARPGFRRWGTQWLEEAQYQQMETDRTDLEGAIDDQAARVERARTRVETLRARHQALAITAADLRQQMMPGTPPTQQQLGPHPTGPGGVTVPLDPQGLTGPSTPLGPTPGQNLATAWAGTNEARARAAAEIVGATKDFQAEQAQLAQLKRSLGSMRPAWPATFDPIDLAALTAPPPPPPDPKAIAMIVETAAKEKVRVKSPFSDSGGIKNGPQRQPPPPADPSPPPPAPAGAAPTTAPAPLQVPFGPRDVDKHPRR